MLRLNNRHGLIRHRVVRVVTSDTRQRIRFLVALALPKLVKMINECVSCVIGFRGHSGLVDFVDRSGVLERLAWDEVPYRFAFRFDNNIAL